MSVVVLLRTGEAEGHLGDQGSGDGEPDEERPGALPFTLEENGPWIELPHFSSSSLAADAD